MKITLNLTNEELVKLIRESGTFSEMFSQERVSIAEKTEVFEDISKNLHSELSGSGDKISMIKYTRGAVKYSNFIKDYCEKNGISYKFYNNSIGLETAKYFVEHFMKI